MLRMGHLRRGQHDDADARSWLRAQLTATKGKDHAPFTDCNDMATLDRALNGDGEYAPHDIIFLYATPLGARELTDAELVSFAVFRQQDAYIRVEWFGTIPEFVGNSFAEAMLGQLAISVLRVPGGGGGDAAPLVLPFVVESCKTALTYWIDRMGCVPLTFLLGALAGAGASSAQLGMDIPSVRALCRVHPWVQYGSTYPLEGELRLPTDAGAFVLGHSELRLLTCSAPNSDTVSHSAALVAFRALCDMHCRGARSITD